MVHNTPSSQAVLHARLDDPTLNSMKDIGWTRFSLDVSVNREKYVTVT